MKRLVPVALAALLTLPLTAGGVPAASAALHVVHGTTLITNTIIERTGATVGLLTTEGFRDSIEIGRDVEPVNLGIVGGVADDKDALGLDHSR